MLHMRSSETILPKVCQIYRELSSPSLWIGIFGVDCHDCLFSTELLAVFRKLWALNPILNVSGKRCVSSCLSQKQC